ncbi:hypothetical protein [Marinicella litoralis]|uniref:Uncharacterized protein n=1 Tax=Marinicella litoralis TaxID=644220 RepID=A0A4R6XXU1_9GAMM|nr:hypothetical protein [Marinicella litoralis]TDR23300.1 hypothetical protein C8D91_0160 [Marinicella litoralis]
MNDSFLAEILAYKKPLDEATFNATVMDQIKKAHQMRRMIVACFSLMGVFLTAMYLLTVMPAGLAPKLLTPTNGLLLSSIGLFVIWLWTVELSSD